MTLPAHRGTAYGFCVAYRKTHAEGWQLDRSDDEDLHVPSHYELVDEACDRVEYLRKAGMEARVLTLLAENGDDENGVTEGRPELI